MSTELDEGRGTEEWIRIDRGELDPDRERSDRDDAEPDGSDKADDSRDATRDGAGSEPPD
jgi:hypothetical protein